jgi:hypothetical protein
MRRDRGKRSKDPLQDLPGIGPKLAERLREIGINDPSDLRGKNPDWMYGRLCEYHGRHVDRCVLYAFRCAVHSVGRGRRDPKLLKWWQWKDRKP